MKAATNHSEYTMDNGKVVFTAEIQDKDDATLQHM